MATTQPQQHADFDGWRYAVARFIEARTGLDIDDLPDCPYADWYEEGVSASKAASRAVKNAKDEGWN